MRGTHYRAVFRDGTAALHAQQPVKVGRRRVVAATDPITHCWRCDYRSRLTRGIMKTYVWCTSLEAAESCKPTPSMIWVYQEIVATENLGDVIRKSKEQHYNRSYVWKRRRDAAAKRRGTPQE